MFNLLGPALLSSLFTLTLSTLVMTKKGRPLPLIKIAGFNHTLTWCINLVVLYQFLSTLDFLIGFEKRLGFILINALMALLVTLLAYLLDRFIITQTPD